MRTFATVVSLIIYFTAFGQFQNHKNQLWNLISIDEKDNPDALQAIFQLNTSIFEKKLAEIPFENKTPPLYQKTMLFFPLPNGKREAFLIEETSNFHPNLAKEYPNIRTFKGKGFNDPTAFIYFDYSSKGLNAMVRSGNSSPVFIQRHTKIARNTYKTYFKKTIKQIPFFCELKRNNKQLKQFFALRNQPRDCQLKTFRLALGCTAEYAQYHGGTVEEVLSAMNATLSIINGIFENDLAIHLELVPNTPALIFLDHETDPYSNNELAEMLGEHQNICDEKIGVLNYDIGHVFGTGLGGVAYMGVVCDDNFKASAASGFPSPEGPIFAIDLVAHEMGHQFGAEHTFNGDKVACAGENRNNATAVEPGSGSTVMGYAGICPPQNVQGHSDAYFHTISLQQIHNYIDNFAKCIESDTNYFNSLPIISNGKSTFYIPKSTPFVLKVTAIEEENENLTYTFEQIDYEIATQPPIASNEFGPLFRSFPPTTNAFRYFPKLKDIAKKETSVWEVLPSVSRIMNFRATIRDNQLDGGCTDDTDFRIEVLDIPPFKIISPNNNEIWEAGTQKNIFWEVGNTTLNPVNVTTVDVFLSIDGGLSFPIELQKNIPNTGNGIVLVPNLPSTTARVMVIATDNIFFDISDENFEINKRKDDFEININPNLSICYPNPVLFEINIGETGNYTQNIKLSLDGLPEGVQAVFSTPTANVPSRVTLTLNGIDQLLGNYEFLLIASGPNNEKTRTLNLNVSHTNPEKINLISPFDRAGNIALSPELHWGKVKNAATYRLEIAADLDFTIPVFISEQIRDTFLTYPDKLDNDTPYFWKVSGQNDCGEGISSDIYTFETVKEVCDVLFPSDIPMTIPSILKSTVISNVSIPNKGKLIDIKLNNLVIKHSFVGDLFIEIESPTGTRVKLIEKICGDVKDMQLSFSDDANLTYSEIQCPPTNALNYQPLTPFANLIGEEIQGDWKLIVMDKELLDGGSIDNWELEICYQIEKPLTIKANKFGISCAGIQDGSLSITPYGGQGNYQYLWSNGANSSIIEGLNEGIYSVTITDGVNLMDTTFSIEAPELIQIDSFIVGEGCIGANNGSITAFVEEKNGPYQYFWSNGDTISAISNLVSATYYLTIIDPIGCQKIDSVNVTVNPKVEIIANSFQEETNGQKDGSILIDINGGTGNYTIEWSMNDSLIGNDYLMDSLNAGSYEVLVRDENACQAIASFEVDRLTSNKNLDFIEQLNIFPNPSNNGIFTVNLSLTASKKVAIGIYSLLGNPIIPLTEWQSSNKNYQFDLSPFQNGVYIVKLNFGEGMVTKPIILLK